MCACMPVCHRTQVTPPSFQSELLQAITRHNTLLQQAVSQLASPSQPTPNAPTIEYYDLFTTVTQIHTDMANEPGIDTTGSCITHRLLYPGMRAMFSAGMAGNTAAASALSGVTRLLGGVSGGVSLSEAFFSSGTRCEDPSRFFWYDEGEGMRLPACVWSRHVRSTLQCCVSTCCAGTMEVRVRVCLHARACTAAHASRCAAAAHILLLKSVCIAQCSRRRIALY